MSQELIDLKNKLVNARQVSWNNYDTFINTDTGKVLAGNADYQASVESTRPDGEIQTQLSAAIETLEVPAGEDPLKDGME